MIVNGPFQGKYCEWKQFKLTCHKSILIIENIILHIWMYLLNDYIIYAHLVEGFKPLGLTEQI